jgi:hypothetical protein
MKAPANDNLFQVRKKVDVVVLSKHRTGQFHSTVAKLLFLAKRGRPNVLLAVSFLTTRVKTPDMDDWKKLLRVLGNLKETIHYDLKNTCENLENLIWYIDGSYAVHEDMKGHIGAIIQWRKCSIIKIK